MTLLIASNSQEIELVRTLRDRIRLVEVEKFGKLPVLFKWWGKIFLSRYDLITFNTLVYSRHILVALLCRRPIRYVMHNVDTGYGRSRHERFFHRLLNRLR